MTDHERYIGLIFPLQTAWPFVHGSKDEELIKECRDLLGHGRDEDLAISTERNDRIYAALERAWPLVNSPFVSNCARSEVSNAITKFGPDA
jgi:hypothetical protein